MIINLAAFQYLFVILSTTRDLHQLIPKGISYNLTNSAEFSEEELLVLEQDVYSYYTKCGYSNVPPPGRRRGGKGRY
jgi:hypothetical protein